MATYTRIGIRMSYPRTKRDYPRKPGFRRKYVSVPTLNPSNAPHLSFTVAPKSRTKHKTINPIYSTDQVTQCRVADYV